MKSQEFLPVFDWGLPVERSEVPTWRKSEFRARAGPHKLLLGWKEESVEEPHPLSETRDPK